MYSPPSSQGLPRSKSEPAAVDRTEESSAFASAVRSYSEADAVRFRGQIGRIEGALEGVSFSAVSRIDQSVGNSSRRSVAPENEAPLAFKEGSANLLYWDVVRLHLERLVARIEEWNNHRTLKKIRASSHVLRTYHDSFLFGTVPGSIQARSRLRAGVIGVSWHVLEFTLALLSGILYVYSTYHREAQHNWVSQIQNFISIAFLADYVLRVYCEPVRVYYVLSFWGLVDFFSVIPVILLFRNASGSEGESLIRLLQFTRILRLFGFSYRVGMVGTSVMQQIILLTLATFGVILLDAGIIQWAEYDVAPIERKSTCPEQGCITFWQALYFLIVTVSTVGYGDITPKTVLGQLVTIMTIIAALSILPIQIGRITSLAFRRPYGGTYSARKIVGSRFFIISGSISLQSIQNFLSEFYSPTRSEDLDAYPLRVVILAPFSPSFELKQILSLYDDLVEFIEGSPVRQSDLERVSADKAMAFFLLADHDAANPQVEDSAQLVRALAVHRFCRGQRHRRDMRILLEVLDPETEISAVWDESHAGGIEVICPVKVHYKMMARSCFVRGLYTLITNLFTSEIELKHADRRHFLTEYFQSFDNEVYPVILPSAFHGMLFEEVVEILHIQFNSVLFGIDTLILSKGKAVRKVLLNARGYRIRPDDVGIVISDDLVIACSITTFASSNQDATSLLRNLCHCSKNEPSMVRHTEGIEVRTKSGRWTRHGDALMSNNTVTNVDHTSLGLSVSSPNVFPRGAFNLERKFRQILHRIRAVKNMYLPRTRPQSLEGLGFRPQSSDSSGFFKRPDIETPEESEDTYSFDPRTTKSSTSSRSRLSEEISLEKAAEELLAWPPLDLNERPHPAVLDRRADVISRNLQDRTLSMVAFSVPHILVCCQAGWPTHLFYFLLELRKPGFENPPVVILYPHVPTVKQWGTVGLFNDVYYLQGSPVYELDLMRGGVLQAEKVVILADQGIPLDFGGSNLDDKFVKRAPSAYTSDVDNIVVAANVQRLNGKRSENMIVEMQHAATFNYLEPQYEVSRAHFSRRDLERNHDVLNHFNLPFMGGKAISSSMLGFLLRSSFYNKNTISIVEQLLQGGVNYHTKSEAVGDVGDVQEHDDPDRADEVKILSQIPVPLEYADGLYSDLFLGLLRDKGMIAIGLFRVSGTLGAPTSYVLTNPQCGCRVNPDDLVYVIT